MKKNVLKKLFCTFLAVCLVGTSAITGEMSFAAAEKAENTLSGEHREVLTTITPRDRFARTVHRTDSFTLSKRGCIHFTIDKLVDENNDPIECEMIIFNDRGEIVWQTSDPVQMYNDKNYYEHYVGLDKGTYFLDLNDFAGESASISWRCDVDYATNYEIEKPDNNPDYLALNKTYYGFIEEGNSYNPDYNIGMDLHAFKLKAGQEYRIILTKYNFIRAHGNLLLFNPDQEKVMNYEKFETHFDENDNTYVTFRAAQSGYYVLGLANIDGGDIPYTLKIAEEKAPSKVTSRLSTAKGGYDDIYTYWTEVPGASGYYVYARRPNRTSKWSYLGRTSDNSYLEKNLYDGQKYEFKVVPYYNANHSRYKSTKARMSSGIYTLKKTEMRTISKYDSDSVKVRWNNITGESGYQISRSVNKTDKRVVRTYATTSGTAKIINAAKGRKYYYSVRAYRNITRSGKTYKVYGPWSDAKAYILR